MQQLLSSLLERYPQVGILASLSGLTAGVASVLQLIGLFFGVAGAVFGCLAGYYTWRVKRMEYHRKLDKADFSRR